MAGFLLFIMEMKILGYFLSYSKKPSDGGIAKVTFGSGSPSSSVCPSTTLEPFFRCFLKVH